MSVTSSKRKVARSFIAAVASILVLATAILLFINKQYVTDQITIWSFTPSQAVQQVSDKVGFSQRGAFYFLATKPEVSSAEQFNKDCPRQEPSSPILGCYSNGRIFIYDITNSKLDGIEEVTAAHEMLHAAWDRLSDVERSRLTTLLKDEYAKHATGDLADRIAYYERNEPGQLVNELHSILPTEVADLSPELELYYSQYFNDRQAVVKLHDQYNGVLKDLNTQLNALYEELTTLGVSIESSTEVYDQQSAELSRAIAAFNQKADNAGFSTQQEFNAERAQLVQRSNLLQDTRNSINVSIDRYNEAYTEYESVAAQLDTLNKSLDSITNLPQAPTVGE
jgi:hypothetical protein